MLSGSSVYRGVLSLIVSQSWPANQKPDTARSNLAVRYDHTTASGYGSLGARVLGEKLLGVKWGSPLSDSWIGYPRPADAVVRHPPTESERTRR